MKVLIFGPSGAGKTYVSQELRKLGHNAQDADLIDNLSSWYDGNGNKVAYPEDADEEFLENHSFYWDKEFLKDFLKDKPDIYLFGLSGNIFDMMDLFDRVYFLKVDPEVQIKRLMYPSRLNPMGKTEYQRENAVRWGKQLEDKAKKLQIPFIDGSLTPEEIFAVVNDQPKSRIN